ncbi:MAG: TetR/AcrR family transcriptional regulator [Clostridiales bacterium]|nr:TetR/AcrR family transcriptional regulator [Clostridiales bacterium]
MRTRTFSEEDKEEIKQKMKEVGIPMLKEQGLIHMSIGKLAEAVGIGKSTFYSFYSSKEEFVEDMLADNRKQLLESLQAGLQDRTKYSVEESKAIVRKMIMNTDSIYRNFSSEDEAALKKMYEKKGVPFADLEKEKHVIDFITSMMDGVKENLDYAVIANMMKIIVLSYEQKEMLHESGLERTIDAMVDLLIASIFEM